MVLDRKSKLTNVKRQAISQGRSQASEWRENSHNKPDFAPLWTDLHESIASFDGIPLPEIDAHFLMEPYEEFSAEYVPRPVQEFQEAVSQKMRMTRREQSKVTREEGILLLNQQMAEQCQFHFCKGRRSEWDSTCLEGSVLAGEWRYQGRTALNASILHP